jgi:aspartyl-tRNA(Asn)/glutamyl-tRNA(Gln) amidotransferase subunit B
VLVQEPGGPAFFDGLIRSGKGRDPIQAAHWVITELLGLLRNDNRTLASSPVSFEQIGSILDLLQKQSISGKIGKSVLAEMYAGVNKLAPEIVEEKGWSVISDDDTLLQLCKEAVEGSPKEAEQYKQGNKRMMRHFMGVVMKASKGKAHPTKTEEIMERVLS